MIILLSQRKQFQALNHLLHDFCIFSSLNLKVETQIDYF